MTNFDEDRKQIREEGFLRISLAISGNLGLSCLYLKALLMSEFLCVYWTIFGCIWFSLTISGYIGLSLAFSSYLWIYLWIFHWLLVNESLSGIFINHFLVDYEITLWWQIMYKTEEKNFGKRKCSIRCIFKMRYMIFCITAA